MEHSKLNRSDRRFKGGWEENERASVQDFLVTIILRWNRRLYIKTAHV